MKIIIWWKGKLWCEVEDSHGMVLASPSMSQTRGLGFQSLLLPIGYQMPNRHWTEVHLGTKVLHTNQTSKGLPWTIVSLRVTIPLYFFVDFSFYWVLTCLSIECLSSCRLENGNMKHFCILHKSNFLSSTKFLPKCKFKIIFLVISGVIKVKLKRICIGVA